MPVKLIVTLLICLFTLNSTFGISDMEQLRKKAKEKVFFNSFEFGFSGKKGNSDKIAHSTSLFTSYNQKQWLIFLTGHYEFEKTEEVKSADETFLHLRLNYSHSKNNNIETFIQYGRDPFKSLVHRRLYGIGHRTEFFKETSLGLGIFFEEEKYTSVTENNIRGNLYLTNKFLLGPISNVGTTLYYQPKLDELNDYRLLLKTSLSSKITDKIDIKIALNWNYDGEPEPGIEKSDLRYLSGVSISF